MQAERLSVSLHICAHLHICTSASPCAPCPDPTAMATASATAATAPGGQKQLQSFFKKVGAAPPAQPSKKKSVQSQPTEMFDIDLPPDLLGGDFAGSALGAFQLLDGVGELPAAPDPADIEKAKRVRVLPSPSILNRTC